MNLDAPFGADQTPEVPAGPVDLQWTTMAEKGQKSGCFAKIMHEYVDWGEIGGLLTCIGKSVDRRFPADTEPVASQSMQAAYSMLESH